MADAPAPPEPVPGYLPVGYLRDLQGLAGSIASVTSERELLETTARSVQRHLRADAAMLWLVDPSSNDFQLVAHVGAGEASLRSSATLPDDHAWASSHALTSYEIEVVHGQDDLLARFPAAQQASLSHDTYVIAPLVAGRQNVGAMVLAYADTAALSQADLMFLGAASALCAGALRPVRLNALLQRERQRADFRAEASRLLGSSLDYELTLRRVADLAGPAIADACAVALADAGGHLRPVAASHQDPRHQATLDRLVARNERIEHPSLRKVMETGESLVLDWIARSDVGGAEGDEHRRVLDALGATAVVAVPIECVLERRGVLVVMSSTTPPSLCRDDVPFLQDLANHAGLAIANADAHKRSETLAAELSEALQSRVVIEQAKGILAERHREHPEDAFKRLHREARNTQQRIHRLASEVVARRAMI